MASILMINPSVNMRFAAVEMKMYGIDVRYAYSSDVVYSGAKRVFYFLPNINICFTTEIQNNMEREDRIYLFKRNIFSKFKMIGLKKSMGMEHPELSAGTFTDHLLLKRSVLKNDDIHEHGESLKYTAFQEAVANNRESMIITSKIMGQGNETQCLWDTDFDLVSTFNKDYFVFFAGNRRVEAYVAGGNLITAGKYSGEKHLEVLLEIIPMISKFSFKKIDEKQMLRNFNPWLNPIAGTSGFLVNDYSFGNISVSMPSAWYDNFAHFIHDHISRKKQTKKL